MIIQALYYDLSLILKIFKFYFIIFHHFIYYNLVYFNQDFINDEFHQIDFLLLISCYIFRLK